MTKEKCIQIAKRFKNRTDFLLGNRSAYNYAKEHNIMDEMCFHMKALGNRVFRYIYGIFLNRTVYIGLSYNPALRFQNHKNNKRKEITDLIKEGGKLVILEDLLPVKEAAIREGEIVEWFKLKGYIVLNKAKPGMVGGYTPQWDKDKLQKVAQKYKILKEFIKREPSAYKYCVRHKLVDEIAGRMIKFERKWNEERVRVIANKYTTLFEFSKQDYEAYRAAYRMNNYQQIIAHMRKRTDPWTKEEIVEVAQNYINIGDFYKKEQMAVRMAKRLGYFEEITAHMKRKHAKPSKTREKTFACSV